MRNRFFFQYPPTKEEFENLWTSALIVVDSSVLLSLYELNKKAADDLLANLERLRERLWIPFRVGDEFLTQRLVVIDRRISDMQALEGELRKICDTRVSGEKHAIAHHEKAAGNIRTLLEDALKEITAAREQYQKSSDDDEILDRITRMFAGRVGEPFSDKDESDLLAETPSRMADKIPPGYNDFDGKKGGELKLRNVPGDLQIWKQMISHSRSNKAPMIFVTDDVKDDWFFRRNGKIIGPRKELRREFFGATSQHVYIYSSSAFVRYAPSYIKKFEVDRETLTELESAASRARETLKAVEQRNLAFSEYLQRELASTRLAERIRLSEFASRVHAPSSLSHDDGVLSKYALPSGEIYLTDDEINYLKTLNPERSSSDIQAVRLRNILHHGLSREIDLDPSEIERYRLTGFGEIKKEAHDDDKSEQ